MEKEKKEIGMEKLIRYLLESKGEEYKGEYYEWYRDVELEQNIDSLSELKPFIKWLVENDKIDTDKLDKKSERKPMYSFEEEGKIGFKLFEVYESLLMLLSISDTPIEDLCGYLKDDSNITKGEIKIGSENQDTQELDMTTTHIEGKEFLA